MNLCKKNILLGSLLLLFFSCKKEYNISPQVAPAENLKTISATANTSVTTSLISNLKSGTSKTYQTGTIALSALYYTDRTYKISSYPTYLSGTTFIKTACDDKLNKSATAVTFTLGQSATVYIAYDSRAKAIPSWLSSWKKSTDKIGVIDQAGSLILYSKDYNAGTVTLGGNVASPATGVQCQYIAAVKAKTSSGSTASTMMLGVNGHSLGLEAYLAVSVTQQIAMLKKMGMTAFRQDISFNSDGTISSLSMFNQLYSASAAAGVTILPMLYTQTLDFNKTESQSYSAGRALGANIAGKNSKYFIYYELGNELDNQTILPASDGNQTDDYDPKKIKIVAAYVKGMDEGIKAVQPSAKTMVNAGWLHYAFLQMLQTYGVKFDIIAYHWYSDMENAAAGKNIPDITKKLSGLFTKPIWFTEVGQRYKNVYNIEQIQSDFTTSFIKKCKANTQVKSLIFYELFDEPERSDAEGHFGFAKWTSPYTKWEYKTAAKSISVN